MCRSDDPSFYDPDWESIEREKIVLRRDLEEDYADNINDEEWLKNERN